MGGKTGSIIYDRGRRIAYNGKEPIVNIGDRSYRIDTFGMRDYSVTNENGQLEYKGQEQYVKSASAYINGRWMPIVDGSVATRRVDAEYYTNHKRKRLNK